MGSFPGQGQGLFTEAKERGLSAVFAIGLSIFRAKFPLHTYYHWDLNSGTGWNETQDIMGSPLAFTAEADRIGVNYRAHFVEIKADACQQLKKRLYAQAHTGKLEVINSDNRAVVPNIPAVIRMDRERPEYAIGSILCDDNGTKIPLCELAQVARECPRMDLVISLGCTSLKRAKQLDHIPTLHDIVSRLNKAHWLIRRPLMRDGKKNAHQWTILVGRNVQTRDYDAQGFIDLGSEMGCRVFTFFSKTEEQKRAIPGWTDEGLHFEVESPQMELF